jgi:hypothetical protein
MEPPLFMPFSDLTRINNYREYLLSTTSTPNNNDQSHPPPNGGSGDQQGNSNAPPGQRNGGRQAASGVTSVNTSPTLIGDGGGEGAAEAGLENFSFKSMNGLLILEDVDEDAEDVDGTMQDELVMLTHDNPMWAGELIKYMQKEAKEKERMQNERLERISYWREDTAVQLTSM